jgi:hypothetical protein
LVASELKSTSKKYQHGGTKITIFFPLCHSPAILGSISRDRDWRLANDIRFIRSMGCRTISDQF